jgi:hypothetical protein
VSSEGELLVIGGTSALPRPLATFERLQGWEEQGEQGLATGEWRVAGVMPYPATMCAAVWLTPDVTPKTGYTSAET